VVVASVVVAGVVASVVPVVGSVVPPQAARDATITRAMISAKILFMVKTPFNIPFRVIKLAESLYYEA
jgi:hypothetical protein